jgi:hypothetical protein
VNIAVLEGTAVRRRRDITVRDVRRVRIGADTCAEAIVGVRIGADTDQRERPLDVRSRGDIPVGCCGGGVRFRK